MDKMYTFTINQSILKKIFVQTRKFFFPIYPVKPFQSVQLLVLLGFLLAIQIVLRKFSIPIPAFRTNISFVWLPVMIAGWFFGPVHGFIFGWISDTVGYLLGGGIWFWLYAIQEPIIGLFAGLVASVARMFVKREKLWWHLIINQLLLIGFVSFSLAYIINWYDNQNDSFKISWFSQTFYGLVLGFNVGFFVIIETIIIIFIAKKNPFLITYLYASMIVVSMILLWSFILGPQSAIAYFQYINGGRIPEVIHKYGRIYYLVPRIIREMIKTPIQSILLTTIIFALQSIFNNIYTLLVNSYLHNSAPKIWKYLSSKRWFNKITKLPKK